MGKGIGERGWDDLLLSWMGDKFQNIGADAGATNCKRYRVTLNA